MLSHCDEKHSEMMWRECSSCPPRDGRPAVAFVYSFALSVPKCTFAYARASSRRTRAVHLSLPGAGTRHIVWLLPLVNVSHVENSAT